MAKGQNGLGNNPMLKDSSGFSRHDLSHYFGYKCSTGHIVPVCSDILNPNERINLKVNTFVRMQPMLTPVMADIDVFIDYFFVPMPMLLMDFERSFSATKEIFTSYITPNQDYAQRRLPLFDGTFSGETSSLGEVYSATGTDHAYPIRNMSQAYDMVNNTLGLEAAGNRAIRLFDYLGYDLPAFYLSDPARIAELISDSATNDNVIVVNNEGSDVSSNLPALTVALMNSGYRRTYYQKCFPWKLLAYNAIFQNWFRIDNRLPFDNGMFNLDRHLGNLTFYNTGFNASNMSTVTGSNSAEVDFMGIKYCPKSEDYFTSSSPTPVVTLINQFDVLPRNEQYLTSFDSHYYFGDGILSEDLSNDVTSLSLPDLNASSDASLSMARLRLVKAQEKMLQIYGRLPKKNYDTFVYALFGKEVPHDVKHELSHLGKEHFKINISQVTAMAATDDASLGEFAGQGAGSSKSRGIKFTAPCHGIIMAVQYIRPQYMYQAGFMRQNYLNSYDDFFLPPYDNLGRQPIFDYETFVGTPYTGFDNIVAWQYRWQEWKTAFNRVSSAFRYGSEKSWFLVHDFSSTLDRSVTPTFTNNFFYVPPTSLNDVMVLQYDTAFKSEVLTKSMYDEGIRWADLENYWLKPYMVFARDPFICLSRIDYSKFSKMSQYSLQTID